jgi:hypothetical protein
MILWNFFRENFGAFSAKAPPSYEERAFAV